MTAIAAAVLICVAVCAGVRGARQVVRGLRGAASLEFIRGIRSCVFAAVASIFALGVLTAHTGLFVLGALFLAEELYETGAVIAALRWGERHAVDEDVHVVDEGGEAGYRSAT